MAICAVRKAWAGPLGAAVARHLDGVYCNGIVVLLAPDHLVIVDVPRAVETETVPEDSVRKTDCKHTNANDCLLHMSSGEVVSVIHVCGLSQDDKQEGLRQQLISDMFTQRSIDARWTLGIEDRRTRSMVGGVIGHEGGPW